MDSQYFFLDELPINAKRAKASMLSVCIFILLCVMGILISKHFWADHTYYRYTRNGNLPVISGWPVVLNSWSWIFGVTLLISLLFMYFMQDWKKPSLAITANELFINQQMIRNTFVPLSNIQEVKASLDGYLIVFKDVESILKNQNFIFRALLKTNLKNKRLNVTKLHTTGDFKPFMQKLSSKINQS